MAHSTTVKIPSLWFQLEDRMKSTGKPMLISEEQNFEIGFSSNLVISNPASKQFECTICKGLPRFPVELSTCGHIFCYECMSHLPWSNENNSSLPCPNCELSFHQTDAYGIELSSRALQNIYSSLDVRCPYQCGYVSSPKAMIDHETWKCTNRPVKCTSKGCDVILPDNQMESHFDECPERYIFCQNCRIPIKHSVTPHHCIPPNAQKLKCVSLSYFNHS